MKLKLEKLDSRQVPQVIILGVLCVGILGYGAVSVIGANSKSKPKNNSKQQAAARSKVEPAEERTADVRGETELAAGTELRLPTSFNPDPFRPTAESLPPRPPVRRAAGPSVSTPPTPQNPVARAGSGAPVLPWLNPPAAGGSPAGRVPVVAPPRTPDPAEVRPKLVVTGTSLVEGNDLAIIELGSEHRIVKKGDVVADNYRVERIDANGIMLTNGKDHFFVGIGVGFADGEVQAEDSGTETFG